MSLQMYNTSVRSLHVQHNSSHHSIHPNSSRHSFHQDSILRESMTSPILFSDFKFSRLEIPVFSVLQLPEPLETRIAPLGSCGLPFGFSHFSLYLSFACD